MDEAMSSAFEDVAAPVVGDVVNSLTVEVPVPEVEGSAKTRGKHGKKPNTLPKRGARCDHWVNLQYAVLPLSASDDYLAKIGNFPVFHTQSVFDLLADPELDVSKFTLGIALNRRGEVMFEGIDLLEGIELGAGKLHLYYKDVMVSSIDINDARKDFIAEDQHVASYQQPYHVVAMKYHDKYSAKHGVSAAQEKKYKVLVQSVIGFEDK